MAGKRGRRAPQGLPSNKSSFKVLPNGTHEHTLQTPYGTIVYTYSPKILGGILRAIFTKLLGRVYYGSPLDFNDLFQSSEAEPPYRYIFYVDEEFSSAQEKYSADALTLLRDQASQSLIEASEQMILEVVFRSLSESKELTSSILNSKSSELLQLLIQHVNQRVKQRVNARPPGGREPDWTSQRCEAFLEQYEEALDAFRDARRIYRQNKHLGDPRSNKEKWYELVNVAHPELPEELIKQLKDGGKNAEPGVLALEYSARVFNVPVNDYLKKVLTRARRARRVKQDNQTPY
jgi:hypothetical protein